MAGKGFGPAGGNQNFNPNQATNRFQAEQHTDQPAVQMPRFQLGREIAAPGHLNVPQAQFLKPQEMAKGSPRGAQVIPVRGMQPQQEQGGGLRLGSIAPAPQQILPQRAPVPALRGPAPAPALSGPALGDGEEFHRIEVRGEAPNGQEFVATYDAVFPRGTRILGASEIARS